MVLKNIFSPWIRYAIFVRIRGLIRNKLKISNPRSPSLSRLLSFLFLSLTYSPWLLFCYYFFFFLSTVPSLMLVFFLSLTCTHLNSLSLPAFCLVPPLSCSPFSPLSLSPLLPSLFFPSLLLFVTFFLHSVSLTCLLTNHTCIYLSHFHILYNVSFTLFSFYISLSLFPSFFCLFLAELFSLFPII